MKRISFLLIGFMFAFSTFSFTQIGIKGGFAIGVPTNSAQNEDVLLGFDLGATYNIINKLRAEFLIEGMYHNNKSNLGPFGTYKYSHGITPITLGLDYTFLDGAIRPFAGLNFGVYIASQRFNGQPSSDAYFGLYPKIGLDYSVTDNILIDLTAKYHFIFSNSQIDGDDINTYKMFGLNIGIIYLIGN